MSHTLILSVIVALLAFGSAVRKAEGAPLAEAEQQHQQHQQQQRLLMSQQPATLPSALFATSLGASALGGGGGGGGGSFGGLGTAGDFGDSGFSDGMGPPDPSKFRTPEELKEYLERLQLYYALVGRPRFGKRSGSAATWSDHRGMRTFPPRRRPTAIEQFEEEAEEADHDEETRGGEAGRDKVYGFAVIF